ncbi:MAG: hypothetical protein U0835_18500 [Isosphaeraceae bacterium]
MSDSTAPAAENMDPLKSVADAMESAVKAAKDGVTSAGATVSEAAPAAKKLLASVVYNTCYGLSYGVVFPSALIARSVPRDNPIVHGFVDGARAAIDMVDEMKGKAGGLEGTGGDVPSILGPDGTPVVHPT